jgi:cell wall-associated NlpC family hydrolase
MADGFAAGTIARFLGARVNIPTGSDKWELWPSSTLRRANLASQAYQLGHMSSWAISSAGSQALAAASSALPRLTPLKRAVLQYALRYAGAPYIWGGETTGTSGPYGTQEAGGFDCSGFVWWVMKMHSHTAGSVTWSGSSQIGGRSTYDMARALPQSRRIPRSKLVPGDIVFWTTGTPKGVATPYTAVDHTGIYLGNGWVVDSSGYRGGVSLNSIGPGSGWYSDHLVFGWRVMPPGV